MYFMDLSLLFITLNILPLKNDISSITTICNVSLFSKFDGMFGKLNKDYWTIMFNVECIVKPSILKVILPIDAISKSLICVKSKDTSLLYNCNIILELRILM